MKVTVANNPRARAKAVIDAFERLPSGEDITFLHGATENDGRVVVVGMAGAYYGLLADEARKLAEIMEGAMRAHPFAPGAAAIPDFIMGLRHTANVVDPRGREPTVEGALQ